MSHGFDRLAKPYRWIEYFTFGHSLERCRFALLPLTHNARQALLLGDGDGRYAKRLLNMAPAVHITAIDASAAMLHALQMRCCQPDRLTTHCSSLGNGSFPVLAGGQFDLVVSHFFLDCFTETEVKHIAQQVVPRLAPHAQWIVSEFYIPRGWMHLAARVIVRMLYVAFHLLTGLRAQRLPDHRRVLQQQGFTCRACVDSLGGLLVSEVWCRDEGIK